MLPETSVVPITIPVAVVVLLLVLALAAGKGGNAQRRDPARWFDTSQRAAGRALAGGRCEYPSRFAPWRRCRGRASECDHFIPWAREGATTMTNLVAACRWHNQTKGARWPSRPLARAIARRRAHYFPPGRPTRPGQRYRDR